MIAGAGGNIGFQVGADGVVVVDSGFRASADAVVAAIKKVTPQPIRYVINTSADPDHVGGNETSRKPGRRSSRNGGAGVAADFLGGAASILSVEQVLTQDERAERQAFAISGRRVADGNLRSAAKIHVPQRRGY